MKRWLFRWALVLSVFGLCIAIARTSAAGTPSVIRMGYPGVGIANRPAASGSVTATMHLLGMLEDEFRKDGIRIEWTFLPTAGPGVNELFSNGLLDFSYLGDLPSVIGRSSGLHYRFLACGSVRGNSYVLVPPESQIQSVADLRGRTVSVQKGTAGHLMALKILEKFGLEERDVRLVNMDSNTAKSALITKSIDAAFGSYDWLALRDQGAGRIIYTTTGGDPNLTSNGSFIGSEDFIHEHPDLTERVVKVYVQAAKWLADNAANPSTIYRLWSKSGFTFASLQEDWKGDDLKYRVSPLIDPYLVARYKLQIGESKRLRLTRRLFNFEDFVDTSFLSQALKDLKLENFWRPRGLDGSPTG
jgi:sulfonate transport system substrate-binding protein